MTRDLPCTVNTVLGGQLDLVAIRRVILTAVAADDYLMEQLVLKGGNALELIHRIGARASVDLDFSIARDFEDPDEVAVRLEHSLTDRFDAAGYLVFDFKFAPRPSGREPGSPWGGYVATFKLIPYARADELGGNIEHMRLQSEAVGPSDQRNFRIEISPFEYVDGRIRVEVDHYGCYVYSLDMIAAEKLRAICQQSPQYERRLHPAPRARDFYDLYAAVTEGNISFASSRFQSLLVPVFKAKEVPLALLGSLEEQREFHRQDWDSVRNAVRTRLREFDYYFDYVLEEINELKPLWVVDSPA